MIAAAVRVLLGEEACELCKLWLCGSVIYVYYISASYES